MSIPHNLNRMLQELRAHHEGKPNIPQTGFNALAIAGLADAVEHYAEVYRKVSEKRTQDQMELGMSALKAMIAFVARDFPQDPPESC